MPYSSNSEVPSYVPEDKKSQWRQVWNSIYNDRIKEGDSKDEAERRAFAGANSVAGPKSKKVAGDEDMEIITAQTEKSIFCPLVKVDVAKREVWGVVTAEVPDRENEICDYGTTVPYYKAVVDEMSKATDGANIFPLRAMHGLTAAGKGISIEFRDDTKEVYMGFKVVDDAEWKKVEESVYTGFSQGGRYIKRWKDGDFVRYTASPGEVSLVDIPCLQRAHFDYVKADGTIEKRAFKIPEREETKEVKKSADEKKSEIAARVEPALKTMLEDIINEHAYGQFNKGMYSVSNFAQIIESLKYLWINLEYEREGEGDESPATDDVKACFTSLLNAFLRYTEEQVQELSAYAAAYNLEEGETLAMTVEAADLQKAAKIFAQHHKKAAAHEEAVAAQHEKIAKAHEARAAESEEEPEGEEEPAKKVRKSRLAFHKCKATAHNKLFKCHSAFAAHHKKCADAHSMKDNEKALKLLEIEEEPGEEMQKTETAPATTAAVETAAASASTPAQAAAVQAESDNDVNKSLEKMLNDKVQKAMEAAFERVLNSPEFSKQIDERLAGKMLEKLGGQAAPTEVKSIPVPRPGTVTKAAPTMPDTSEVPPEFQQLVAFE